ncbi:MAG TPA: glycosyltransferase [Gemmatimonadaceae bacterium]|nr:glycosyltransferase [Gemmatimonadaceae bacterium]
MAGKFLFVGENKLGVRGVTYGTFRPRDGCDYPDRARVSADFAAMAAAGFNAVRVYSVPPEWLLDEALRHGLWVQVGIPWEQHVAFLDERGRPRSIERRIREGVARCAGHPALLCFAVGNEIPAAIVRWSGAARVERFIRRLYDAAKDVDPEGLVTYVNFPTTEYLNLPFLDLLSYNVYLESTRRLSSYIARLHNQAENRPLIMAELGLDSRRNGGERQAGLVSRQVRTSIERGCAGSFVFAWTDEWYRGGQEVTDWEFGLTTRDRRPKPALEAVARAVAEPLASPQTSWPRASVVICVYNGAATIADCLQGATALDYPNYEVIVVDDGSTDDTARIASAFDVRLIRTENGGLSRARNIGIEAATGDIIAFTDGDARPDADWLTYIALGLQSGELAGVGGPNIAPAGGGLVAQCVANAPGGPVCVLSTDQEAEHVPGCNMAFQAAALRTIGGFDPRFRTAGDDVDICWRIQECGWRIGFSPAAVVWHHARSTVAAYWRQQRGYGAAEALLAAKWPHKYNAVGHVTWGGRVYGPGVYPFPFTRSRIYAGTWGNAPFQSREATPPGWLWEASAMPEWYLGVAVLAALTLCGLLWTPLLLALPLFVLALGTTVARGVVGGARARFTEPAKWRGYAVQRRALTMLLHLLQPLARLRGRFLHGLVPWRARLSRPGLAWPFTRRTTLWREVGEAQEVTLARIEKRLAECGAPVRRDDGYHEWDLEVEGGALGAARLRSCVEWHGGTRQLVRFALHPQASRLARVFTLWGAVVSAWALSDRAYAAAALLGSVVALVSARSLWECGISVAALAEAVHGGEAQRVDSHEVGESVPLAVGSATAVGAETPLQATG